MKPSRGRARIGAIVVASVVAIAIVAALRISSSRALTAAQTAQSFVANFGADSVSIFAPGSDGTDPDTIATVVGASTDLEDPAAIALAPSGTLGVTRFYLANCGKDCGGVGASDISRYDIEVPMFGGILDTAPGAIVTGSNTDLHGPLGVALDSSENIYVANDAGGPSKLGTVTVYPAGSNGNVTPTSTIAGSKTGLDFPTGIALDSSRDIYVTNCGADCGGTVIAAVRIYAAGATGNIAPTATISGGKTGLADPFGIVLDSSGNIYVANEQGGPNGLGSVTVYAAGSVGDAKPTATIGGGKTGLVTPTGIALDSAGNIYVANFNGKSVTVYGAGSTGNIAPVATITGANSGLNQPIGIAVPPATQAATPTATISATPTTTVSPTPTATSTGATPTATSTPTATPTATPGGGRISVMPKKLTLTASPMATASASITITNTGTGPLNGTVGPLTHTPPLTESGGGAFTLDAGMHENVTIIFSPTSKGSLSDSIAITSDDPTHKKPIKEKIKAKSK